MLRDQPSHAVTPPTPAFAALDVEYVELAFDVAKLIGEAADAEGRREMGTDFLD